MRFDRCGLAWLLLLASGCGQAAEGTDPAGPPSRSVRPAGLETVALEGSPGTGNLAGSILFSGTPPERFPLGARKKTECTTHPDVEHLSDLVVVEDGRLAGVLVRVTRGIDEDDAPAPPSTPAVLDQRGCLYTPHVLALRAGQPLEIRNSDPTPHNVNARPKKNEGPGNRNMGAGQPPLTVVFEREELGIDFRCDIHPWMEARVHVLDHPWFDVTGIDGAFLLEGLAPGRYTIEARHEELGRLTARDVRVEAGSETRFTLSF